MGSYFRSVATPVEKPDCLASLRSAWLDHFKEAPKDDAIRLLTTQWGLESTWGKHGYCYNLGNIRASGDSDFMYIPGNELIDGQWVEFSGDVPSDMSKFRAFRSLPESAAYFVNFMANRSKVLAVLKGSCDPMDYCEALKAHFYYTDTVEHYSSVFLKLWEDVKDLPVPTTKAPDYAVLSPDPAGDPAKKEPVKPAPAAATPAPAPSSTPQAPKTNGAPPGKVVVAELTVSARLLGSSDPLPCLKVKTRSAQSGLMAKSTTSSNVPAPSKVEPAKPTAPKPPAAAARPRRGASEIYKTLPEVVNQEPPEEREAKLWAEIEGLNYPEFAASFVPLEVTDSKGRKAVFQVGLDCFAIGTEDDWVHAALSGYYAQKTAEMFGAFLPTNRLVLEIYSKAAIKLVAHPFDCQTKYNGKWQRSTLAMRLHEDVVQGKIPCRSGQTVPDASGKLDPKLGAHPGVCALPKGPHPRVLVSGHLKEVIISHEDLTKKLAFWGFFTADGRPIQRGFGCRHGPGFADYSHGFRLIGPRVVVDGKEVDYEEVVTSPEYASLVFAEGGQPCKPPRYPAVPARFYMGM